MKRTLVLLADYLGTGKSYLMRQIQEAYPTFQIPSPDVYKEEMWSRYGFDATEEKETNIRKAWMEYYKDMEDTMQIDISILSDYPFNDKQESRLGQLAATHTYQIMTIRLVAGLDTLYERRRARDLDDAHHPGHVVGNLHRGDIFQSRDEQPCIVGCEEFMNRCKSRGCRTFALGTVLELDVTDFSHTDYPTLMQNLNGIL